MKMLIEKQAAAAASRLNSPSRLEAFAADSPPHRRRPRTPTKVGSGGGGGGRGGRSDKSDDRGGAPSPSPRHTSPGGGIALSELVSATTPPRRRSSAIKLDARGGNEGAELRRSLAQETYTKTFTGMQVQHDSLDHHFAGCNVESSSVDLSVGAERTTVLKAVSEGETRFRSMAMASDTDLGFPSPDGPGRQFLAEFGEFPVYLVNRDMQVKIASTGELYPMMPPGPVDEKRRGLGPGEGRDEAIVAASREREKRPARDWGVQQVLDWLEDELELGEYRREFARAKVDGALLLNLEKIKDKEEEEMGKKYADMDDYVKRLDRDRVRLVTKLKVVFDRFDKRGEGTISAANARDALLYMGRDISGEACASWLADRERHRGDSGGQGGDISFVDFCTAYSALFADEDPYIDLGETWGPGGGPKEQGVSVTGSGHVRLRQKKSAQGRGDGAHGSWAPGSSEDEEEFRTGSSRHSPHRKTPRGDGVEDTSNNGDDHYRDHAQAEAFEALRSVKKLAEVKRVFDRFAVDGMLTTYEALQALTEAGCTAPRTHAGRYLRSRRFFGLRREVCFRGGLTVALSGDLTGASGLGMVGALVEGKPNSQFTRLTTQVTFFEFLRSMAALGVHDSGAHVTGFAPSMIPLGGGGSSIPFKARRSSRGPRDDDDDDDDDEYMSVSGKRGGGRSGSRRRTRRRGRSGEGRAYDDDEDQGGSTSTSADDEDDRHRRSPVPHRGVSPRRVMGAGGVSRGRGLGSGSGGDYGETRRSRSASRKRRPSYSPRRSRSRLADSGASSSDIEEDKDGSPSRRGRRAMRHKRDKHRSRYGREGGKRLTSEESDTGDDGDRSDGSAFGSRGRGRRGSVPQEERGGRERQQTRSRGGGRNIEDDDHDRTRDRDRHREKHLAGGRPSDRDKLRKRESGRGAGSGSGSDGARGPSSARSRRKASSPSRDESNEGRSCQETRGGPASSFSRGDRVEARYRARGTKFYKGTISRVNSDDTVDVAYDDGEKEIGIATEHVRSLEPGASGGGGRTRGSTMARGDRVEVRYRGKGTNFYKGNISRVNSDGTMDITYDDGEKEIGIAPEHVRSLEPQTNAGSGGGRGHTMARGDRVEVRYRGKGTKFYKGKISRVNSDCTMDIAYDDGEKEIGIAAEHVRSLEQSTSEGGRGGGGRARAPTLMEGDKVEANFRGRGRFYPGRISRVNVDGTFNIDYDDGEKERGVTDDLIRASDRGNAHRDEGRSGGSGRLERGDRVEAKHRGRGSKFYKGKISRVNSDGTFDISYDDGEKEIGIAAEHVRSLEPKNSTGDNDVIGSGMAKGDRVEVRYRGKGTKFYKGKISRVNSDDTMDIAYDDGEKEIGIAAEHVRSLDRPISAGGGGERRGRLERGDRVEARCRGKGSKFYKGKISRVNSDDTLDIAYDDGEKEIGIAVEHVRSLDRPISAGGGGERRGRLERGDRVEARYRGKGSKFYKGKISRVNSDDTLDIAYDDGEKEIGIAVEHVRSLDRPISAGGGGERRGRLERGDRVEARYRGKGSKFYKGKISRVNSDETMDITYDDGEKEIGIATEHVRSLEPQINAGDSDANGSRMAKGDRVEVRYRGKGTKFYKGKISRVNSDATFDISYDDGEKEIGIAAEHVRSLEQSTSEGGRGGSGRARAPTLMEGDKVEANFRGRGRFYPGRISRVNVDGTFNIDYDDGEKEHGVTDDLIRASDRGSSQRDEGRSGASGRLERGDRVEARYRGRGSKFYKGKISRVNSDGTFDISYDDGEKEIGIAAEHVRSFESQRNADENHVIGSGMAKGDRVEVRYRGKGTKFYKGKISRVNSDGTFDISYDDGEKEIGIAAEHVRSFESQRNADENHVIGSGMAKGDRVEVRYRGKGTKFYKGKISRVNSDATFDVAYDDGEKEIGIAAEHVRSFESQRNADENHVIGSGMAKGDRVEVRYRGKGTKFYKGKISRVNSDATFDVAYDDGEKEIGIAAEHVRSLDRPTSAGGRGPGRRAPTLMEGDKVEANFRGRGRFYPGRISRVNVDGTFNIDYDDGEKEHGVTDDLIRASDRGSSQRDEGRSGQSSRLERGDRVEARYRGRGTKFYTGKISRVNSDATFDVSYDDGEKEIGIAAEHVRSLESPPSPGGRGGSGRARAPTLMEGDKVEANFRGRGRFYSGRISRVNLDGTFNIDYDDGEKERGVTDDLIRASDRGNAHRDEGRSGGSGRLERGDRVEARYRGRGSKFYKGKISRVNSDGTFDISYDDGEKEIGIATEHVRSLKSVEAATGERGSGMAKGDRVEARYRGKGTKFYKGKISRVNSDDTFDIAYDDGEKEIGIAMEHVRSLDRPISAGGRGRGERMTRGDRVEARYRARGTKFYKGKISRVNSDETMDITYDDGEKEIGIAAEHVRSLEPQHNAGDSDTNGSRMAKGDRVEVRYRGKGTKFYKGKISRVNSDATFDISYDDGEKEIGIAAEHVRSLEQSTSEGGRGGSGRARAPTLMEGDKVEANFRGRGRFYPGRISRVNVDGTFNIDYDDGEKEHGVTDDLIRASDRGSSQRDEGRSGQSSRHERGDRVEARYRGRGTKFYKGKISRVNSDGTFDISYDDGEKEIGIAAEHVRSFESQRNTDGRLASRSRSPSTRQGRDDNASEDFAEGDKVEGRFGGRSRWFRATVERKNRDGTYWLVYADGDEERAVENSLIRRLGRDGGGGAAVASPTSRFKAMAGHVSARNTIDDEQVKSRRGIQGGQPSSSRRDSGRGSRSGSGNGADDGDGPTLLEGDLVEGNFQGRGRFYSGRISRINLDGTFNIDYNDGEKERGVKRDMIRSVDSIPAGARQSRRGGSYQ
ncbi:unnamed protein product [Ectocarpus sp. CCAP 1310/34]|nr:unnamed protein product [Ectocarpus sp. CCAP 1310/34]